jgi:hypothetical protein
MHLSSGRPESEIPSLNKKAYEFLYHRTGYYAKPDPVFMSKKKFNFDPIAIKNITLKLVVPKTVLKISVIILMIFFLNIFINLNYIGHHKGL